MDRSPLGSDRRRRRGVFVPSRGDDELLQLVALAVRRLAGGSPGRLSRPRFDAGRVALGEPEAPTAAAISRRLGVPWSRLVEVAGDPATSHRIIAAARRDRLPLKPTWAHCHAALLTVALRFEDRGISRFDYDLAREEIAASGEHVHLTLPSGAQIAYVAGGWSAALRRVGLHVGQGPEARQKVEIVDAIELCLTIHRAMPNHTELWAFAKANRLSISRTEGEPWSAILVRLRANRAREGLPPPPAPVPSDRRPDFSRSVLVSMPRPTVNQPRPREHCLEALIAFLDWLPKDAIATEARYQQFAAQHPEWPWYRSLQRHGGLTELLPEARRIRDGDRRVVDPDDGFASLRRLLAGTRAPDLADLLAYAMRHPNGFTRPRAANDLGLGVVRLTQLVGRLMSVDAIIDTGARVAGPRGRPAQVIALRHPLPPALAEPTRRQRAWRHGARGH